MRSTFLGSECVGLAVDGRFPLVRWIGGSDQTSVYLTHLKGDPRAAAAIKLIPASATEAEASFAAWKIASKLSHPHLVRLFGFGRGQVSGQEVIYVVSEYAEEVLSEVLPERPLTSKETRDMLEPTLDALSYLHSRGLVHGHLKPSNITVVGDQLKLSVDGLCFDGESRMCSLPCCPPEAAKGTVSPATDIWSLGVLLVESLTQKVLVLDDSHGSGLAVPASLPAPFLRIVQDCLEIDPGRRSTAAELRAHLQDPSSSRPRTKPAKRSSIAKRPSPWLLVTIVAGAFCGGIAVIASWNLLPHHAKALPPPPTSESVPSTPVIVPPAPVVKGKQAGSTMIKGLAAQSVLPEIPEKARQTIRGRFRVVVRVQVNTAGDVSAAAVESQGPSPYFAKLALQAAQKWKFSPVMVDHRAVDSAWRLDFLFSQTGVDVTPLQVSP